MLVKNHDPGYGFGQVVMVFKSLFEQIAKETGYVCEDHTTVDPCFKLLENDRVLGVASYSWSTTKELTFTVSSGYATYTGVVDTLTNFPKRFTECARMWFPKNIAIRKAVLQVRNITLREIDDPIVYLDLKTAVASFPPDSDLQIVDYD